jgi:hypothetical protein
VIAMRCSFCPAQLHLAPATLNGPPDRTGKSRQLVACRSCWKRIYERSKLRNLRPTSEGGRLAGVPAVPRDADEEIVAGCRISRRATPHDGTPPGQTHRAA